MATKKSYSEKLRDPRWQKLRLEIFERDNWKCCYCNDSATTLNVHHLKYTQHLPHDEPKENLQTVCEDCHMIIEERKKISDTESIIFIKKLDKPGDCHVRGFLVLNSAGSIRLFERNKSAINFVFGIKADTLKEIFQQLSK